MSEIRLTKGEINNIIKEAVGANFNKRSVINKLYRIVEPFTKHRYSDDNWSGVSDIINAIKNAGYDVTVSVKDGGYRNSRGGNTLFVGDDVSYWKEYELEIPVEDKVIHGRINCHAAGTVEDIFSSYDQTCSFW